MGLVVWLVGLAVYHIANPTTLGSFVPVWQNSVPPVLTEFGGSLPSFIVSFILYGALGKLAVVRNEELSAASRSMTRE